MYFCFFCSELNVDQCFSLELVQYCTSHSRFESFSLVYKSVTLCILTENVQLQIVLYLKCITLAKMVVNL